MNPVAAAIIGYVALQIVIGYLVSRRISTQADYLVAGRRLGYFLGTFTIFATWFGAETCVSSAGIAVQEGVSLRSVEPFAYGASVLVMGLLFAAPLWRRRLLTLADLFRVRYSGGVERLAALLIVPSSVLWAAAQVKAFGHVLSVPTGWDETTAMTVAAAVVIAYTTLGGLLADAVTDLVQGLVVMAGLMVLAVIVVSAIGGPAAAWSRIDASGKLSLVGSESAGWFAVLEAWAIPICGSLVAQELVSRVIATRSAAVARRAAVFAAAFYILVGTVPVALGLMSAEILPELHTDEVDRFLPHVAREYLPPALFVVFSGALISAILSTVDSALLAAGSLVSQNILVSLRPDMTDRRKLLAARLFVVAFGGLAYLLAFRADSISLLIEEASAFGSSGLVVIFVFGLFTRFGGPAAAYGALVVGSGGWILTQHVLELEYPYLVSLGAAFAVFVAAGLRYRARADER